MIKYVIRTSLLISKEPLNRYISVKTERGAGFGKKTARAANGVK